MKEALKAVLDNRDVNISGYPHSAGLVEARSAIAEVSSTHNCQLTHEVIVLKIDCLSYVLLYVMLPWLLASTVVCNACKV